MTDRPLTQPARRVAAAPARAGSPWPWTLAAAAVGLLVTAAAVLATLSAGEARVQRLLNDEVARLTQIIGARLQAVEHGMRGARGAALAAGWDRIDRAAFARYSRSRPIDQEFPGVHGIGIVRRVAVANQDDFIAAAAADGWPGFEIRQFQPHDGERWVTEFIEPAYRNRKAVGLDIASEPRRRQAGELAWRSGQATLTPPIELVQAGGRRGSGFLMLLPVYASNVTPGDEAVRLQWAIGFVCAPLQIDQMLAGVEFDRELLRLEIHDVAGGVRFFDAGAAGAPGLPVARMERIVGGRTWRISLHAGAGLEGSEAWAPGWMTAGVGVALTALLSLACHAWLRERASVRELRAEQARRALALQTSRDAVVLVDPAGVIVDWNQGAESLLGWSAAEALGRPASLLLAPDSDGEPMQALLRQALDGHAEGAADVVCRHREGQGIDVSALAVPLAAEIGGVALSMRDIRSQKAAERQARALNATFGAALRENGALLEAVKAQAIYSVADHRGRIVEVNDLFCRVSQYSREELLGQTHRIINSGHHGRAFWQTMWRTIAAGRSWRAEVCNRAKDGSLYWVDSIIAPVVGDNGQIDHYVSIRFEITQAKRAQERLRASEALLDRAGRIARVGAWDLDLHSGRLTWTAQTASLHEAPPGHQPTLDEALSYFGAEAGPRLRQAIEQAARAGEGFDLELPMQTVRGRAIHVRVAAAAELREGVPVRLVGALQDITERKAFELRLEQATARAEAASRAKSEFLANMSHEIRSPLNAIVGLGWLLRQTPLDAQQVMLLDRARHASDTLAQTIDNVLDIARIEAGEMPLAREPMSIARTVDGVVGMMAVHAQSRGLRLELELAPALPARVHGDAVRLGQVLTNLLSNAVKFTQAGSIRCEVGWQPLADARGIATLLVNDTGIGIDAEALPRIFEPFVQADGSTTRRFGGTGLGLAIVKRLVERMGGEIGVESQPGVGSQFRVRLPFDGASDAPLPEAQPVEPGADALAGSTVLVVDDSDINRDVARRILERKGARVLQAEDGAQALAMLRDDPRAADLVLMDVHMPVMDGFEATRRIRGELGLTALPVLALTAGVTAEDREGARRAGMDEFVAKPLDPVGLLRGVVQRLGVRSGVRMPAQTGAAWPLEGWPQIDGVDVSDARERLGGDLALFRSLLGRLFAEHVSLGVDEPLDVEPNRATAIARVHRLCGNAGTMGMRRLHAMTAAIESHLREGQLDKARRALPVAAAELERLREACRAFLEAPPPAPLPAAAPPLVPALLDELRTLLARNNMRATAIFEQIEPALRAAMDPAAFDALRNDVNNLDFGPALRALETWSATPPCPD